MSLDAGDQWSPRADYRQNADSGGEWQRGEGLAVSDKTTRKAYRRIMKDFTRRRMTAKAYRELFCTTTSDPTKKLLTRKSQAPAWLDRLRRNRSGFANSRPENALRQRTATRVLTCLRVIDKYARAKAERGLLEYED